MVSRRNLVNLFEENLTNTSRDVITTVLFAFEFEAQLIEHLFDVATPDAEIVGKSLSHVDPSTSPLREVYFTVTALLIQKVLNVPWSAEKIGVMFILGRNTKLGI